MYDYQLILCILFCKKFFYLREIYFEIYFSITLIVFEELSIFLIINFTPQYMNIKNTTYNNMERLLRIAQGID